MMGTDPFLWIGIADHYSYPDTNPPFVIRSSLAYPILPITDSDPAHH